MPRICTSEADPVDLCKKCYPKTEQHAKKKYGNLGDGPDNRGNCFLYNADHPPYEEVLDYECEKCHRVLTINDN